VLIDFADQDLRRLHEEPGYRLSRMDQQLTRAFRKAARFIEAASDERDLAAMKSLRFEKLKGARSGQHSIRLHNQWRLILQLVENPKGTVVVVVEVVDYH
jgi:proteic killer suppression protein